MSTRPLHRLFAVLTRGAHLLSLSNVAHTCIQDLIRTRVRAQCPDLKLSEFDGTCASIDRVEQSSVVRPDPHCMTTCRLSPNCRDHKAASLASHLNAAPVDSMANSTPADSSDTVPAQVKAKKLSDKEHPLKSAAWWSRFTWSWFFPLLFTGRRKQLDEDDVWELPTCMRARAIHDM